MTKQDFRCGFWGEIEVYTKFGVNDIKHISMHTQDVPPCIDTCYKIIFFFFPSSGFPQTQVVIIKQACSMYEFIPDMCQEKTIKKCSNSPYIVELSSVLTVKGISY